jgi:sec-independent protein translocase protein TatA
MSIGFWQLVLILLIVLLVFGAGKLPKVMGDLGKGVRSLREGLKEGEDKEGQNPSGAAKDLPKE